MKSEKGNKKLRRLKKDRIKVQGKGKSKEKKSKGVGSLLSQPEWKSPWLCPGPLLNRSLTWHPIPLFSSCCLQTNKHLIERVEKPKRDQTATTSLFKFVKITSHIRKFLTVNTNHRQSYEINCHGMTKALFKTLTLIRRWVDHRLLPFNSSQVTSQHILIWCHSACTV